MLFCSIGDAGNNRRRILLSSSQREPSTSPLHARVPLTLPRDQVCVPYIVALVGYSSCLIKLCDRRELFVPCANQVFNTCKVLTVGADLEISKGEMLSYIYVGV